MGDIPQEFADIFVKEKTWSDADLAKFKTHKYKELPEKTSIRLVKLFNLCSCNPEFLPERPFSRPINIAEITVAIASQLKTTHLTPCLTSGNDKYQPNIDTVVYPSYISDPKVVPELSNELLDDRLRDYFATDVVWNEYGTWLMKQHFKVQVAITAYIATVSLRVGCKNPTSIEGYMKRHLEDNLERFYGRYTPFPESIAIPSLKFLTKLKEQFQLQTTICSNFYANCLDAYYTEYSKPFRPLETRPTEKTDIVASALLSTTACNGLYILHLMMQNSLRHKDDGREHDFLTSIVILQFDTDPETKDSGTRFNDFFDYYCPSWRHVACDSKLAVFMQILSGRKRDILWPWARILDATYFKSLTVKKNMLFFAKFVRLLDPDNTLHWRESITYKNVPRAILEKETIWREKREKIIEANRIREEAFRLEHDL